MTRIANPDLPKKILDIGERTIIEQGHEAINMRKLAAEAGVTATSIYHYFESKEELLLQLKILAAERLNKEIKKIEDLPDPYQIIRELGRIYVDFAEQYPLLYRFLFESANSKLPVTSEETPVLYHTYFVARKALEQMTASEKANLPPAYGAMMGWSMLHGFCSLLLSGRLQPAEGLDARELKEIFLQMYAHGPGGHGS